MSRQGAWRACGRTERPRACRRGSGACRCGSRQADRRSPRGGEHVLVVDEDALRGLRPQVRQARGVLDRAEVGPQHRVELPRLVERAAGAAVRAGDVRQAVLRRVAVLLLVPLEQVVGAVPLVTDLALGERVGEVGDVPAGLPHLTGEDHARVQAHDVLALLHHRPPPLALDVVLQLHAERAVVPGRAQAAVNLAGRVHETAPLAQVDNGVEAVTA